MPWLSEFDIRQVDDTYFMLLQDLVYYSKRYKVKITVPSGMVSDGPSVPRVPLLFWLFGHKGKRAAVIHDWLYRNSLLPREVCDDIFKEALLESGKFAFTACGMYAGVRVGGWPHYGPIGKAGCLDPRIECEILEECTICAYYFAAYKLTVVRMLEDPTC
jgi:hypothetical protein